MTYSGAIKFLNSLVNYEKISNYCLKNEIGLERLQSFLGTIGDPQDHLRCLHIAGSKGKGSTCVFIANILRQEGFRVGLYTSPHLVDWRERIRVISQNPKTGEDKNFEGMISRRELADIAGRLRQAVKKFKFSRRKGGLTFFEIFTAIAFVYFKEKNVDFTVLETGLGGRLDATNTANSWVCAITPISYEHTDKLGSTLGQIAQEKAGVIKNNNPSVISARQEKPARKAILYRSRQVGARLYEVGKDIKYSGRNNNFCVRGIFGKYRNLKIRLIGRHQVANAALAVGVVEALRSYGFEVGIDSLRRGLYSAIWPARCEVICHSPLVILDGAQNEASAAALKKAIQAGFKYNKLILVLGVCQDKDIRGICRQLYPVSDKVILTKADNPRASQPQYLASYFKYKEVFVTENVNKARSLAWKIAGKRDLILVTGSLFVAAEFR